MGKNLDTSNIFSSYMDNVLLKEAVKAIEVDENGNQIPSGTGKMPSVETLKATRERLKQQRAQEMINQKNSMVKQGIPMGSNVYTTPNGEASLVPVANQTTQQPTTVQPSAPAPVTQQPTAQPAPQPAKQPQADDESGYEEVETTQETIPANVQAQPLVTADDGTSYTVDQIKSMIGDVTKSFDQDEQESDDEGWEEMGSSGDKENVTDKYETVISGNTTTIRPKNLKEPFEDQDDQEEEGWQEAGEPETENVTDQYTGTTSEAQYKESVNIAKFLKSLSEKNYSLANKYLKNIVENKIKRKISGAIK